MNHVVYSIQTERLLMRCFQPKDAFMLKEAIDDSIDHLRPFLSWTKNEPEDIEKKIERMKRNRSDFDLNLKYNFGIFVHDNSKLIGSITLFKRDSEGAYEIGYWIRKDYLNMGYATEATTSLVKIAFEVYQVERLIIRCNIKNEKSMNIPRKLNFNNEAIIRTNEFEEDGTRKQQMLWVLFKEEYEKSDLKSFPLKAYDVIDREIMIT